MRPSGGDIQQNQAIARVIRAMTADEFAQFLESLSEEDAREVSDLLRVRLAKRGEPETNGAKLRNKAVFGTRQMVPLGISEIAAKQLDERAKEVLGDNFEDPSLEEVAHTVEVMCSEFGLPRTRLWLACLVAKGAKASPRIEAVASGIDGLGLRPEAPAPAAQVLPDETDHETREGRRNRRREQREERARLRETAESSRRNNRRFKSRRVTTVTTTGPQGEDSHETEPAAPVPRERRVHPRLARYPKADARHELVGGIIIAWIRFTSEPDNGKNRPCVILAVEDRRMVVKPLYSHPRYGAGFWRAVEIMHWEQAGLSRKSWAGDEIHTVRRFNDVIGRLHVDDWNRICLGESIPGQ
ncbi:MAG: hypothetical protein ACKODP_09435 [Actinomycetota bacterium]